MKQKITGIRLLEIGLSIIVLLTSITVLCMDINLKGIPALSLGILMALFCYEEWTKEKKNMIIFLLFFAASILNCFVGIMLFF